MRYQIYLTVLILFASCFPDNPKKEFQQRTGLLISDSTFNVDSRDTYFPHEGEYSIVFKTTESQIRKWLDTTPPWNNSTWLKGQIPHEIGIACQFNFPERVGVGGSQNDKRVYIGDKDLENLLNDTTNYYSYREDCCTDDSELRFHDGALLIIQPKTRMIYYSNWNY
jgi:hypothetical protein